MSVIAVSFVAVLAVFAGYHMLAVPPSLSTTTSTSTSASTSTSLPTSTSTTHTSVPVTSQIATYETHSPPTSQWLILSSSQLPLSVTANDTGSIPRYYSSSSLNATKIGVYCEQTATTQLGGLNTGTCTKFVTYRQTGWYWDKQDELLFIHYLGGPNVLISVVVPESALA